MEESGAARGGAAVGDQHRLEAVAIAELQVGRVDERVVQLNVGEVAGAPGGELLLDGPAYPRPRRAGHGHVWAERVAERGLDVAVGQNADPAGDQQALERVGAGDVVAEQPR
jgi:hypothetical protein